MKSIAQWILKPPVTGPSSILVIRILVGSVFVWEGLLKFFFANLGTERFFILGFPFPELAAHLLASIEIIGGTLLVFGLLTRMMALLFIVQMIVAILSTKISLYVGMRPLPVPFAPPTGGMWAVIHEVRSEYAQLLCCIFLMLEGAGRKSLDFIFLTTHKIYTMKEPKLP